MTKWSTVEVRSSTVLSLLLSSLWPQPHTLPSSVPTQIQIFTQIHTNTHKYTQIHTYTLIYTSTNIYATVDMSKIHSGTQIRKGFKGLFYTLLLGLPSK